MTTPEGQPARPLETELKLPKSIVTWKLDTTFLWENAAELTYSSTTACITQASEQRRRTERVAFRLANGYLLTEGSFRSG